MVVGLIFFSGVSLLFLWGLLGKSQFITSKAPDRFFFEGRFSCIA